MSALVGWWWAVVGAGDGLCSPYMEVLVGHGGGPLLALVMGHRWRWWGVALAIVGVDWGWW